MASQPASHPGAVARLTTTALLLGLLLPAAPAGALDFRNNTHTPIGATTLAVVGSPPDDSLVVSNIGSGGIDGVAIGPANPGAPFEIGYGPFGSSSFMIRHGVSDDSGGKSFVITSTVHSASEPMAYETGGQPEDSYYANFFSGAVKVFQSPAIGPGVVAESVLFPKAVVVVPGASGDEISIEYILPSPEELVYVPEQLTFTGDRIVIERIEENPAAAGPPLSVNRIEVTAAELAQLTILDETPGPPSVPALSRWNLAALAAALMVGVARWTGVAAAYSQDPAE